MAAKRLPLIFILASHLFLSVVLSTSIITIENKCNHIIWPVIYSWNTQVSESVSPTGFALKTDETRVVHAPSSWYGLISARTLCSNNSGYFSCITGDCESGKIECPGTYSWAPVTYVYFRIGEDGINSHTISVEYGYNLPLMVVPSQRSRTCISSGCVVDIHKTCPNDLMTLSRGKPIGCSSSCMHFDTPETCCTLDFKSKQNCKPTQYTQKFERACPLAQVYTYDDNNSTITCSNSTDYVITFCPSSKL